MQAYLLIYDGGYEDYEIHGIFDSVETAAAAFRYAKSQSQWHNMYQYTLVEKNYYGGCHAFMYRHENGNDYEAETFIVPYTMNQYVSRR